MIHTRKIIPLLILLISIFIMTACDDKWDEHYNQDNFDIPEASLKEFIEQNSQISIFYKMLQISGYDELLNSPQSFTVWAPVNEALSDIDTTDHDLVIDLVENHVTRGKISTSNLDILPVRMLNGKNVEFALGGSTGYTFGNNQVISEDAFSKNGFLHIIDGYVPIVSNLWEFIEKHESLDSLRDYLYGQSEYIFDPINSTEIGVNDDGQIIYDSAFKYTNHVLDKLGALETEDSTYTVIMPDDQAWEEAYSRIESYFNFADDAGGADRQKNKSQFTLVQDMVFRGQIDDPSNVGKMVSTNGNTFYEPGQLFTDVYETHDLSNGIANVTSLMPFSDSSSWYKEIKVEAEELDGRTNTNNVIYSRTSYGSGLDISENKYILVDPTSSGSSVEFPIPNTLSAKYNIYCVFVPGYIVDFNDLTPTKVKFELTYIRRSSGSTFFTEITPDINTTFPVGLTKMFVDQFDFQYANIIDDDYDKVAVKLKVINDVSSAEQQAGIYTRTMRIDCIILEPVF